jgi:hypothetical protein
MAKRGTKVLPARKEDGAGSNDDSLLIRSAESLGRVIGSLQRQVRDSSKSLASVANDTRDALPELPRFDDLFGTPRPAARKRTGTRKTGSRKKTASKASRSTKKASRARTTGGTRKRAAARKTTRKR